MRYMRPAPDFLRICPTRSCEMLQNAVGRVPLRRPSPQPPSMIDRWNALSRSLLEMFPWYPALPDDRQRRADREFTVVRNRNSDAAGVAAALHYDVAAAAALLDEFMLLKDATHLASRQDAKSTHASLRSSSRRLQSAAGA
jgi:hypothetical protein